MASIDLKARRVLMASWLYYEQSVSVMSDGEFDALCKEVADELEWFEAMGECEIDELRVFQLGTAEELRATGCHVWLTYATVGGAISWYKEHSGETDWVSRTPRGAPWRHSKRFDCKMRKVVS